MIACMPRDATLPPTIDEQHGTCPWCRHVSNFQLALTHVLARHPIWRYQEVYGVSARLEHLPYTRLAVLECMGCDRGVVVVETRMINENAAAAIAEEGQIIGHVLSVVSSWEAVSWWPLPSQAPLDESIPAAVQEPYAEGMRALAANAPNAAVSTLRSALVAMVDDRGTDAAKAKRDLKDKLKQFIADGGLAPALGDWAEHVHLYGNAGAHPEAYGKVSVDEAQDVAALLRSLLEAVYVLPANIARRRAQRMPKETG